MQISNGALKIHQNSLQTDKSTGKKTSVDPNKSKEPSKIFEEEQKEACRRGCTCLQANQLSFASEEEDEELYLIDPVVILRVNHDHGNENGSDCLHEKEVFLKSLMMMLDDHVLSAYSRFVQVVLFQSLNRLLAKLLFHVFKICWPSHSGSRFIKLQEHNSKIKK